MAEVLTRHQLDQKKQVIIGFLQRCNSYGRQKIENYENELRTAAPVDHLELNEKILRWKTYCHFNDHTLDELMHTDNLDDWM